MDGAVPPDPEEAGKRAGFDAVLADVAELLDGMKGLALHPRLVSNAVRNNAEGADTEAVQRAQEALFGGGLGANRCSAMFLASALLRDLFMTDDRELRAIAVLSVLATAGLMAGVPVEPAEG